MKVLNYIRRYFRKDKELCVGFFMLICCVLFLCFVYNRHALRPAADFSLQATFSKVDGIREGTPVRMGGIHVGTVQTLSLTNDYKVRVTLRFDKKYSVPDDTVAMIISNGFLGSKYVELMVGGSEDMLESGDSLAYTQDVLLLDELIQRVLTMMRSRKHPAEEETKEEVSQGENQ